MSFPETARMLLTRRRFVPSRERSGGGDGHKVRRIVLTGGPGSGKSTAASFLAREFVRELWVLPEAATMLYKGGLPRGETELGVQIAQRAIFGVQRSLEQSTSVAHSDRVQLCDRGTVDGAAYWPAGTEDFFQSMGTSHQRELMRYDAVIFLRTAAHLPAGYERDLDIRTEDRDEAIALDQRMAALYEAHPNMIVIESSGSFLDKLVAVRAAVDSLLGGSPTSPGRRTHLSYVTGGGEQVVPATTTPVMGLAGVDSVDG